MQFKTHVTPKQTLPVLESLLDRGLTVAEIVKQSGVSRAAIENMQYGKNSRRGTYDKLCHLLMMLEMRDLRHREIDIQQRVIEECRDRNDAYAQAHASLWGRLKTWLTARFA